MKLFRCDCAARPLLHFENTSCNACGRGLGFVPSLMDLRPHVPSAANGAATGSTPPPPWHDAAGTGRRPCANRLQHGACNWMVEAHESDPWCLACRANRLIPDLSVSANLEPWKVLEAAKRRCLYTLLALDIPLDGCPGAPPLGFRFMADSDSGANFERPLPGAERVLTGHDNGTVTINLAEADTVARTRAQVAMAERYRTPLGHFRHETGHWTWVLLAAADAARPGAEGVGFTERFRVRFGDERTPYADALQRHYADGPPPDWRQRHVSAYASAHPWEDWAETWAHYLHMIDTLETQQSFALETTLVDDAVGEVKLPFSAGFGCDAGENDFDAIVRLWIQATLMLNSLNRSMGLPDPYPFVLNATVIEKLRFVHEELLARHEGG